ncbi:hypothetical protein PGLA_16020 [Paenibacillus glacialis]|uniref:Permease n=1 Tax=Paenibacillus glacialis TaxID=494026 RepID=A0A168JZH7_9BACL|nr:hypothetical protein PGLA_16020 [Paenibacillus glacialis]
MIDMHWKKYIILATIFIPLGVISFLLLPLGERYAVMVVPLLFWLSYYTWIGAEKKRDKDSR